MAEQQQKKQSGGILGGLADTVGNTLTGVTDTVGNTVSGLGEGVGKTVGGATKGLGDTTKAVGNTAKSGTDYVSGGNKETADNPLGLSK